MSPTQARDNWPEAMSSSKNKTTRNKSASKKAAAKGNRPKETEAETDTGEGDFGEHRLSHAGQVTGQMVRCHEIDRARSQQPLLPEAVSYTHLTLPTILRV